MYQKRMAAQAPGGYRDGLVRCHQQCQSALGPSSATIRACAWRSSAEITRIERPLAFGWSRHSLIAWRDGVIAFSISQRGLSAADQFDIALGEQFGIEQRAMLLRGAIGRFHSACTGHRGYWAPSGGGWRAI